MFSVSWEEYAELRAWRQQGGHLINRRLFLSGCLAGLTLVILGGAVAMIGSRLRARSGKAGEPPARRTAPAPAPAVVTTRPGPLIDGPEQLLDMVPRELLPKASKEPREARNRRAEWARDHLQGRRATFRLAYTNYQDLPRKLLVHAHLGHFDPTDDPIQNTWVSAMCPKSIAMEVDKFAPGELLRITGRIVSCNIGYPAARSGAAAPPVWVTFEVTLDDATVISTGQFNQ